MMIRLATLLFLSFAATCLAGVKRFQVHDSLGSRNHGVWKLTDDPAIRDEANYHNIQCWSPNGRYTCYTHWGGNDGPGGKGSAQIHVVDLLTNRDILVEKGIYPRWAKQHNWLFYTHWTKDGTPPYETGTQVKRYNADTGEIDVIAFGVENLGGVDSSDTWLFGSQRYRGEDAHLVQVRIPIQPGSAYEILKALPPALQGTQLPNPRYPVIKMRHRDSATHPVYGSKSIIYDLDGKNIRIAAILAEEGHHGWSGDGTYLLSGNKLFSGRRWDQPYPSTLEIFANNDTGDISPMDKAGRYICGANLKVADTRSGDAWRVVNPRSKMIHPAKGDFSTLSDIDPKGSPDGTKIHYHSTFALENLVMAQVTSWDPKKPDEVTVDSTDKFPESGAFVCMSEVIAYEGKTTNQFTGLTRRMYDTLPSDTFRPGLVFHPLSAYVLPEEYKARSGPIQGVMEITGGDRDHPLAYQRYTDCYIVVARLPFPPHLRQAGGSVELIPGEHHWETQGYRIFRDEMVITSGLFKPGDVFELNGPGSYTAVAVEWSGLESPKSLPLRLEQPLKGKVLDAKPEDFSWTREVWRSGGKKISRDTAMRAGWARMEVVHRHDGVIARESWVNGQKSSHHDLNADGFPTRRLEYENGVRVRRYYWILSGEGEWLSSEEHFDADGNKVESIRYYSPLRGHKVYEHYWYVDSQPVKKIKRGDVVFDLTESK